MSPECSQAMSALQDHGSKAMPSGIVDANRHRQNSTQLSKQVQLACASARTGGSQSSGRRESVAGARSTNDADARVGSSECARLQRELQDQLSMPVPTGMADASRHRQNVSQRSRQYEQLCLGGSSEAGEKTAAKQGRDPVIELNPFVGQPSIRCPDGKYVRGSSCQLCPDGSYVSGGTGCQITGKGTFVEGGKPATMCPDGSMVSGRCTLGPGGRYIGQ